jgi:quercetin dioxygenase-like cupin family protein
MYQPKYYEGLSQEKIVEDIKSLGFEPKLFSDPPGKIYAQHEHPTTKLLAFLSGSMKVTVWEDTYDCGPGDKILIPGSAEHSAIVGDEGCTFFWAERLF